jgi:BREX protein BrxB
MGRIEQLAEKYRQHIGLPWPQTAAGSQRVIMVVYEKDQERSLLARKELFAIATRQEAHQWFEVNVADSFAHWMAAAEYRDAYFEHPDDLQLKLEEEFPEYVARKIRAVLEKPEVTETSVVAVFGVGALFGFTRVSRVLKLLEPSIRGRLVVFFPGTYDQNNYRLLDARDGWNYLAVPITLHSSGGY